MHVVQVTGPQNSAAKLETVRAVIIHAGSCSRVKINSMAAAIAYKPSRPRRAFACRRPSSQTPHDHREHTVGQAADQFVGPSKGNRRSLSKAVVLALHKRWRRLPPTKQSPSQVEGDCFYRRLVPAPVTLPDSRQPDRHSIPIGLGPAQFNEFYRQCPPQVFPTLRIFWGGAGTADRMLFIIGNYSSGARHPRAPIVEVGGSPARWRWPAAVCTGIISGNAV